VILIGVAAASWPLQIIAANPVGIIHPERFALVIGALWGLGLGAAILARAAGASRAVGTIVGVVFVLGLQRGDVFVANFGLGVAWILVAVLVVGLGVIFSRLGSDRAPTIIAVGLVVFLASSPVLAVVESVGEYGNDVTDSQVLSAGPFLTKPDIFVIVVDGYAGLQTFDADFEDPTPRWKTILTSAGFQVPESVMAAYPTTAVSVPSLLDMSYPVDAGPGFRFASVGRLIEIGGGDNNLVRISKENGYSVTMVEAGWSGSGCGPQIDNCVASPFLDESMFLALGPSIISQQLLESNGSAFTAGALRTMQWLEANAGDLAGDEKSDLVVAHVTAPHPPFFLDSACRVVYQEDREIFEGTGREGADDYLEQAACVDSFLERVPARIPENAIVVVVADHGTDTRGQLGTNPDQWGEAGLRERMNPLLAVRSGSCSIGDSVVLPNVLRRVLSCLLVEPIPDLPNRMFVYAPLTEGGVPLPIEELPPDTVAGLLRPG
jgi:hypothetical protein